MDESPAHHAPFESLSSIGKYLFLKKETREKRTNPKERETNLQFRMDRLYIQIYNIFYFDFLRKKK